MKHRSISSTLATVALAACACVSLAATEPAKAAAKAKDADKKTTAAAAPAVTDDYRMGAGDKLRIEVYKDPQLSQSAQVRPDGKITLPLVGDMMASGLTPIELRDLVTTKLKEYVTNPTVTVIVVEATPAVAYVMGEVNHPGAISVTAPITVMQALALGGGLKDFADAKNIRILRKGPSGVETISFNYKNAVRNGGAPIYLRAGDTVVVPD